MIELAEWIGRGNTIVALIGIFLLIVSFASWLSCCAYPTTQPKFNGATSMWDKIKAWFKHSVTILWARVVALLGLLLAAGQSLLQDPNVNGAIQTVLQPKFIPYYIIAIGLITEIARRRTARATD